MRVVWLCHFSNSDIRQRLDLQISPLEKLYRMILKLPSFEWTDYAIWITNSIKEFEKIQNIELHIVAPHYGMKKKTESFSLNGIHYHFFKPDDNNVVKLVRKLTSIFKSDYTENRKIIKELLERIAPDLIHLYGAENPYYGLAALDIDTQKYPLIVSLQTLMADPVFAEKQQTHLNMYKFRCQVEKRILKSTKYISSSVNKYRDIVWDQINPDAIFLKSYLSVAEEPIICKNEKKFDFVYYASMISKAADFAIEAFAIVCKKYPDITLNIIGATSQPFTRNLQKRIIELGIKENVIFSGRLPTHGDVIKQIQFARFALLPIKIDIISSTIREAMACGLPVITTITPGTPILNERRESVLLSEQGDFEAMAKNMINLINSPELESKLVENAKITLFERWNNKKDMEELALVYKFVYENHKNGSPIPEKYRSENPYKNGQKN